MDHALSNFIRQACIYKGNYKKVSSNSSFLLHFQLFFYFRLHVDREMKEVCVSHANLYNIFSLSSQSFVIHITVHMMYFVYQRKTRGYGTVSGNGI